MSDTERAIRAITCPDGCGKGLRLADEPGAPSHVEADGSRVPCTSKHRELLPLFQSATERATERMACGHLKADLHADPTCRYCDEGYSRIQSSVTKAYVHVDTPVGRVVCTGNPTFIFKESPTDTHHRAMPTTYCRTCAELQSSVAGAYAAAAKLVANCDNYLVGTVDRGLQAKPRLSIDELAAAIRALTPADARQAQAFTNQRLFDLVRYQRSELYAFGLITDGEYATLAQEHSAVKRLEDYDAAIASAEARGRLEEAKLWDGKYPRSSATMGFDWAKKRIAELEAAAGSLTPDAGEQS